jgi:hypothetical protein
MRECGSWGIVSASVLVACGGCRSAPPAIADSGVSGFTLTLGTPTLFATHAELVANGFTWGPSDGTMGAASMGGDNYDFFGAARGSATCTDSPSTQGAFRFTGTLDHLTGLPAGQCKALFTNGSAPTGWVFDKDYAGGGSVVPFKRGATTGLLMTYHGEVHWKGPASNGLCGAGVPCFYGGIGMAVSLDDGATFKSVGQIIQAYPPLSDYQGGSVNLGMGYGSIVVADANGKWIAAPPADLGNTYLYVFFEDYDKNGPGPCGKGACVTVARARFDQVLDAVVPLASSNPTTVAGLFHKYDATAGDPWSSPATSGDPTENTASGHFTPLFSDETDYLPSVIWDNLASAYLMVHHQYVGGAQPTNFQFRSSTDLLHWSVPIATFAPPAGKQPFYPTLVGETGDPLVGGAAPRVYFSTFDLFPDWSNSELDVADRDALMATMRCFAWIPGKIATIASPWNLTNRSRMAN